MTVALQPGIAAGRAVVLGLSEWHVADEAEAVLTCLGLGSCVALCLHDVVSGVGGMAHMVLPDSALGRGGQGSAKFVDAAVPLLVAQMLEAGASRTGLTADLVGGARMLSGPGFKGTEHIGARNAEAALGALHGLNLRVRVEETGGTHGRTVRLHVGTGELQVSSAGGAPRTLSAAEGVPPLDGKRA